MKVLFYGDSNTYGYDPRTFGGDRYEANDRWPDILSRAFGWEHCNMGLNGRCLPRRKAEAELLERSLAAEKADRLIIMLGTNDILLGTEPQTVSERLEAFVQWLDFERSHILILAPPSLGRGEWVGDDGYIALSRELALYYEEAAAYLGTAFIDCSALDIELSYDGVHFSPAGHRSLAVSLFRELRKPGGFR